MNEQEKKKLRKAKIFIVIIIAIFILGFFLIKSDLAKQNNFEYKGLRFTKINLDNLTFYTTTLFLSTDNKIVLQTFNFRNDPKKLEKISFNVETRITKKSYVSFTPEALKCKKEATLAGWELGDFLGRIGSEVKAGVTEHSEENANASIINCSSSKDMVIILKAQAKKTRIYQDKENENCIILEARECQLIEAVERFILEMLLKMKKNL